MKFASAASLLALLASSQGFVPRESTGRAGTELYKYRPTKWSPQTGATQGATRTAPPVSQVTSPAPRVAAGPSLAELAKEWKALNTQSAAAAPVSAAASGPKKSYGVSRWSPETGSRPMTLDASGSWTPSDAGLAPTSSMAAPVAKASAPVAPAVATTSGAKKSYGVSRWGPETGSRPMTIDASGSWTPPAGSGSLSASAAPVASSPIATGPVAASGSAASKTSYSVSRWGPQTGSRPMTLDASGVWTPPNGSVQASSMASAATPAAASSAPVSAAAGSSKKSYGVSRWSPETGSRPMTIDASGSWTSPAGSGSSIAGAVSAAPVAAAPVSKAPVESHGPKTSYGVSRWGPQTGSRPMTIDASGSWTPPAGAAFSRSSPEAPKAAAPSMGAVAKEWSAVNTQASAPKPAAVSAPKKSFSVSRWSPQTGSRPMTVDAIGGSWTPSTASTMAAKAAPVPVPASVAASAPAPVYGSTASSAAKAGVGPKNMYSVSKWSPRADASKSSMTNGYANGVNGANGASRVNGVNGAAHKVAAPAVPTMKTIAQEWASMNRA